MCLKLRIEITVVLLLFIIWDCFGTHISKFISWRIQVCHWYANGSYWSFKGIFLWFGPTNCMSCLAPAKGKTCTKKGICVLLTRKHGNRYTAVVNFSDLKIYLYYVSFLTKDYFKIKLCQQIIELVWPLKQTHFLFLTTLEMYGRQRTPEMWLSLSPPKLWSYQSVFVYSEDSSDYKAILSTLF